MTAPNAAVLSAWLDELLQTAAWPDYPNALNGLQLDHRGPVRRVAAAVDFSQRSIDAVVQAEANFLLVHHGMFWGGAQHIRGAAHRRLHTLISHDIAVYASHLPLDAHPELGNNVLLAAELSLVPTERFGMYEGSWIGVAGVSEVPTRELLARAEHFASALGGTVRSSTCDPARVTTRWAVITGAGVGSQELRDAQEMGIDTLIVGEGPHHTTVEAPELGIVIIYAGHYATETLGIRALATRVGQQFQLPQLFLHIPTGS